MVLLVHYVRARHGLAPRAKPPARVFYYNDGRNDGRPDAGGRKPCLRRETGSAAAGTGDSRHLWRVLRLPILRIMNIM